MNGLNRFVRNHWFRFKTSLIRSSCPGSAGLCGSVQGPAIKPRLIPDLPSYTLVPVIFHPPARLGDAIIDIFKGGQ